jgi:radical SAM superfamily enzyme YgiQ (UPF0313 family)
MSSLGFHIIYDFLNTREDVFCERVVYPYGKSLETGTNLKDFDMVGFSLQYEQDYYNVLDMLREGGIAPRKTDRTSDDPLIIAGGPCASSNPLPMTDFIDVFLVGEAEMIMDQFIDTHLEMEDPRNELDAFLDIKGVYVPDNPADIAIVEDMRDAWHPIKQVIPETDDKDYLPAFGRAFLLGVSRGCTRGCRFCMAGCMYRPRRETPLKTLFDIAEKCRKATGLDRVALIGAAISDYSQIEELCTKLYERDFQITTPSLRIESVSDELLTILSGSGLRTITIAPESTWRIRKVLNKPITDEDIIQVIHRAAEHDLNVKLYFMLGLPTEEKEDLEDLIKLIARLNEISKKRSSLRISINPFIPKPHTPFQWMGFDYKTVRKEIKYLKSHIKRKNLKIDSPRLALKQYVLSQGNADLGEFIYKSWLNSVPLKEWENIAPHWSLDSELPWDNIQVGIKKEFLKEEYHKALDGEITPWCEVFGCYDCGGCGESIKIKK